MAKSPAVILFDSSGVAMAVEAGVAIPVGTQGLLAAGSDGTNALFLLVDASGRPIVVGAGVAGTPAGGVVSIQGVAGGSPIPISGSVTATDASVGDNGSPAPAASTQIGGTDGTNLQAARVFDGDAGGGTQYVLGAILRKSASGGSVEAGTSSDPLRVDPTGATTQPISAASLPLPTGAATEATLATRLADSTFIGRINTFGQKVMALSTPVVLASDQSAISVIDNGGSLTVDTVQLPAALVGGRLDSNVGAWLGSTAPTVGQKTMATSVPVVISSDQSTIPVSGNFDNGSVGPTGAAAPAEATQVAGTDGTNLQAVRVFDLDSGAGAQYVVGVGLRKAASGGSVEFGTSTDPVRIDPTGTTTQPISAASLPLPTGAATEATLASRLAEATFTARINTQGQKTMAGSTPVVLASDQTSIPVTDSGGSLTVDGAVTANQGSAAVLSARWPVQITDGTNTMPTGDVVARAIFEKITDGTNTAVVKAASTAALATDPALVVAISPNNTLATSNSSVGANNAAAPSSSTQIAGTDGTNLQAVRVFDGDTGAGTQYVLGAILRRSASGGTVEAGTSTDPFRVDPTGTTTQPISAVSLPLPTGAATEATLATRLAETTFTARVNTLGQKAMGASTPVVLASDQTAIPITDNGGTLTVDGVVTANIGTTNGLALDATLTGGTQTTRISNGANTAAVKAASTAAVASDPALVVAVSPNNTIPVSAASLPLPAGAATEATLATRLAETTFTARINTLGQKTAANSTPVVLASDQTALSVTDNGGSLTVDSTQLPAVLVSGRLDTNVGGWLGSTAPTVGQKTSANSIPIVIASDQSALPTQVVGTHANAWNAATTGTNGNSTAVDCQYTPYVSVFGNTSGTTTISIQASQNNTNFYTVDQITISSLGGGDFGGNYLIGARYVRLQSSTSRTVTATIAGKA